MTKRVATNNTVTRPVSHVRGALSLAAILAAACAGSGRVQPDIAHLTSDVTFTEHVAPILFRACAFCHHPGGSAPFSVLTYNEAKVWAPLISAAVESRRMPPWLPAPGYVEFAGERRLSEQDIALIRRWAAAGAPRGNLAALPPLPFPPEGWQLGEPDLIVEFPSYTVPAGGSDIYRNFVAGVPNKEARYIRAVEVHPGDPAVVHHGRLMVDTTNSSRVFDEQDPEPGFDGMDLTSKAVNPDGFSVGWTPGKVPWAGDDDLAWPLGPGTDLVLQLHFRPHGQSHVVAARVGLYFAPRPPSRRPVSIFMGSLLIEIPADEPNYVVADSFELPVDVTALGAYPHAHFLAREMQVWARLPGGDHERWLLRIDHWDFNWQDEYRYAKPIALPRGSMIMLRYAYDNSSGNPRNPNSPPRTVAYGPKSTDEMASFSLQLLSRDPGETDALRRAVGWKEYSDDMAYLAHRERALADSAAARGELDAAISHYRKAVLLVPDARAHYALGMVLALKGERVQATVQFRQALRLATEAGDGPLADEISRRLEQDREN